MPISKVRASVVLLLVSSVLVSSCKKGVDKEDPIEVDDSPVVKSEISSHPPKGCGGGFYGVHYGDAYKTLREAEDYKAGKRDYYVRELSDRRNEYLWAAISPTFRAEWFSSHKIAEKDQHCMSGIFDELGAAAKRTLPKYQPRGYVHHQDDDDDLITAAIKQELPDAEILKVGVSSPTWNIDKRSNGIPDSRYKYGMAWVKPKSDDGFCRIAYINIVQDYAGGESYAESVANYISMEPAGCKD